MWLLRDAKDLSEAVVEMPEQLRRFDGHPSQKGVQSLRVEPRLRRQRLTDVTVPRYEAGQPTVTITTTKKKVEVTSNPQSITVCDSLNVAPRL